MIENIYIEIKQFISELANNENQKRNLIRNKLWCFKARHFAKLQTVTVSR